MSAKSKKSAKAIDRPFDADLLARARLVADSYQVILSMEDGHWYGRGLELPHVFGDGPTVERCVEETRQALTGAVALLLEEGSRVPAPARENTRTHQVNVRLTAEEKILLETSSKRKGFNGLSDFIRAAALESAK
jgi:predicted RNase H-like HicB family nuclease